jgi:hypothetical protein
MTGKLTEKLAVLVDHKTRQELRAAAEHLGVPQPVLLRALIVRGVEQARAARNA